MALLDQVRRTIERHDLIHQGDRVVIGVSGGPDSTALLHVLTILRETFDLSLHVAHLDHGLRRGSADDAAFVRQAAAAVGVPVTVESADVRALAVAGKWSLEAAGRQARYAFFEQVAAAAGASAVATGHTQDDQIETIFMRLLQGGRWEGLAGIPAVRPLGAGRVVRPLLEVRRQEIERFLLRRGLTWRTDPTNQDRGLLRNWIRLEALPRLEAAAPEFLAVLLQLAETASVANRGLEEVAVQAGASLQKRAADGIHLALRELQSHPPALRRRILVGAIREIAGTSRSLPGVTEDRADEFARTGRLGTQVDLGMAILRRGYETLLVAPRRAQPGGAEYRLDVPGAVVAETFGVIVSAEIVEVKAVPDPIPASQDEAFLDADAVRGPLRIRSWVPGDRFTPMGLQGKKKVHDLFVDDKVPRWERGGIPLIVDTAGRIVWVVGRRLAEAGRIRETTRRVVHLHVRSLAMRPATRDRSP